MRNLFKTMTAVISLGLIAGAASAHHTTAMFDWNKDSVIKGAVVSFEWTNPHTFMTINVPNAAGGVTVWRLEGRSPNTLNRKGWNKRAVSAGDQVEAHFFRLKDGQEGGYLQWIKFPDGRVLKMFEDNTTQAEAAR